MDRRMNIRDWADGLGGVDCPAYDDDLVLLGEGAIDATVVVDGPLAPELAIMALRPREERWLSEFWLAPGGRVVWVSPPVD